MMLAGRSLLAGSAAKAAARAHHLFAAKRNGLN